MGELGNRTHKSAMAACPPKSVSGGMSPTQSGATAARHAVATSTAQVRSALEVYNRTPDGSSQITTAVRPNQSTRDARLAPLSLSVTVPSGSGNGGDRAALVALVPSARDLPASVVTANPTTSASAGTYT